MSLFDAVPVLALNLKMLMGLLSFCLKHSRPQNDVFASAKDTMEMGLNLTRFGPGISYSMT
jgi:hypothetical protein